MAKSNFETIKYKTLRMYAGYMSSFEDGKAVKTSDLIAKYEKGVIPASLLIILMLLDLANKYKDELYINTSTLVDFFNQNIKASENRITENNVRKILSELNADNIIFSDYTRYFIKHGQVKCYTGLISGDYPAYIDFDFKELIDSALRIDDFSTWKEYNSARDYINSVKDISKLEYAYNNIRETGLAYLNLDDLIYIENNFKYINFAILKLVKPFYDALNYAHKNKWEASSILKETTTKREDNYINRHIYLNIELLAEITGTTSKRSETYKLLKADKKRRLMRFARRLGITLYKFILKTCSTKSEYNTYINKKLKFQTNCREQLNDKVLANILNENKDERGYIDLYIPDMAKAKRILNKFIRFMSRIKEKITSDDITYAIDILFFNIKNKAQRENYSNFTDSLEKQFNLKYLATTK